MTLRDIKAESLRLMALGDGTEIETDDLSSLMSNVKYRSYLDAMPGAVNRALGRLEQRRAIPPSRTSLSPADGSVSGPVIRFDLSALIPGFFAVDRVISDSEYDHNSFVDYRMEGDTLVLPYDLIQNGTEVCVMFFPLLPRISSATPDSFSFPLPDRAAALIPYYVKSDLFNEDEPGEAAAARNIFEAGLDELSCQSFGYSRNVCDIYRFSEV